MCVTTAQFRALVSDFGLSLTERLNQSASTKYTDIRTDWPARSAGYDWEVALAIAASFDENTLVLGQTFHSTYYTVFDKSNNNTSFAPATDACYDGTYQIQKQ